MPWSSCAFPATTITLPFQSRYELAVCPRHFSFYVKCRYIYCTCVCIRTPRLTIHLVQVGLFIKVLRGLHAAEASDITIKLTQREVCLPDGRSESTPFLTFVGKGPDVNVTQDMSITRPYRPDDVDILRKETKSGSMSAYYLDLRSVADKGGLLPRMVDKLRGISDHMTLSTTFEGDLHIQVASCASGGGGRDMTLGSELSGMPVLPAHVKQQAKQLVSTSAEARLQEALANKQGDSVQLDVKHFKRVLDAAPLSEPMNLLLGLNRASGVAHVMFSYANLMEEGGLDKSISVSMLLPLRLDMDDIEMDDDADGSLGARAIHDSDEG